MDDLKSLVEIKKYTGSEYKLQSDLIVRECSFTIFLNGSRFISLACLPNDLEELAIGFLLTEGLIDDPQQIKAYNFDFQQKAIDLKVDVDQRRIDKFWNTGEKTSGCGSTLSAAIDGELDDFPEFDLDPDTILKLMNEFIGRSQLFRETGGVHLAALIKNDEIVYFSEDIGRHSAVDKVNRKQISAFSQHAKNRDKDFLADDTNLENNSKIIIEMCGYNQKNADAIHKKIMKHIAETSSINKHLLS